MIKIKVLNSEELAQVNGGGISTAGWFAIGGGVVFLIGMLDGILRPYRCN